MIYFCFLMTISPRVNLGHRNFYFDYYKSFLNETLILTEFLGILSMISTSSYFGFYSCSKSFYYFHCMLNSMDSPRNRILFSSYKVLVASEHWLFFACQEKRENPVFSG